jgi:Transposase DNA-binding/Transposase DDE domain
MHDTEQWAQTHFGQVDVGDVRRTARIVQMAAAMARRPEASLPQQMGDWKAQKGAYRLLDNAAVSHQALSQPHWDATRQQAREGKGVVLWVHDITELDYSHHRATQGLGPIGDHRGRGWLALTSLGIGEEQVLGVGYQQVWTRSHQRTAQSRRQRAQQPDAQPQRWREAVQTLGSPPQGVRWIHVADREADDFAFFDQVRQAGADFCVRIKSNRRLVGLEAHYLLDTVRQIPSRGSMSVALPAQRQRPARTATLEVSWQAVTLQAPDYHWHLTPLQAVALRVWEVNPPPDSDPLEWWLLTTVPILDLTDALTCVTRYTQRWRIEEYHRCLKTGCQMETRRLQQIDNLYRLFALVSIVALRLLQLRDFARQTPQRPALEVLDPLLVQVLAHHLHLPPQQVTLGAFWRAVAQLGGFPARKSDGQPGWQRLWAGWSHLLTLVEGVQLAQSLPPL